MFNSDVELERERDLTGVKLEKKGEMIICNFKNDKVFSFVSLLAYCYWFMFYRILHMDKDLYNNLPTIMEERKDSLNKLRPVVAVCFTSYI